MQWSDETVERATGEILHSAREEGNDSPVDYGDAQSLAKAALAAVAECKEVRELVEALDEAIDVIEQGVNHDGVCKFMPAIKEKWLPKWKETRRLAEQVV